MWWESMFRSLGEYRNWREWFMWVKVFPVNIIYTHPRDNLRSDTLNFSHFYSGFDGPVCNNSNDNQVAFSLDTCMELKLQLVTSLDFSHWHINQSDSLKKYWVQWGKSVLKSRWLSMSSRSVPHHTSSCRRLQSFLVERRLTCNFFYCSTELFR